MRLKSETPERVLSDIPDHDQSDRGEDRVDQENDQVPTHATGINRQIHKEYFKKEQGGVDTEVCQSCRDAESVLRRLQEASV